jgi:Plavaka transposase
LPDAIVEFIRQHVSSGAVEALKTHCRRELFHSALKWLFDDEFMSAWKSGLIVQCADGIVRRVFPRIFTWSADYPEK